MTADERFTVLYRAHYDAVLRYAVRRTDLESARDVAAETFLVAWRRLDRVPAAGDQALPWLYGVAAKALAGSERSRRRRGLLRRRVDAQPQTQAEPDPAVAVVGGVSLVEALSRLSSVDQEVLRLAGWEELDLAGIAVAMGCSRTAASGRLHRARRRLFVALEAVPPTGAQSAGPDHGVLTSQSDTVAEQEIR